MKRLILFAMAIILLSSLKAQEMNKKIFDENAEEEILYGYCTLDAFNESPFVDWFVPAYQDYTIDEATLSNDEFERINDLKIKLIIGTWCGDSQEQVPAFIKILDKLVYESRQIEVIAVNKNKEAEGVDFQTLNIEKVPTIIFYFNNKEVGRIIETPEESLEKDILKIISNM